MNYIKGLLKLESGQDLVEYAMLAGFISITTVATHRLIGPLDLAIWEMIQANIESV